MTESEAWEAIADTLEACGMPQHDNGTVAQGLCVVIYLMRHDGIIPFRMGLRMSERIRSKMRRAGATSKYPGYLYRPGACKPRIALARRFAQESK